MHLTSYIITLSKDQQTVKVDLPGYLSHLYKGMVSHIVLKSSACSLHAFVTMATPLEYLNSPLLCHS